MTILDWLRSRLPLRPYRTHHPAAQLLERIVLLYDRSGLTWPPQVVMRDRRVIQLRCSSGQHVRLWAQALSMPEPREREQLDGIWRWQSSKRDGDILLIVSAETDQPEDEAASRDGEA